MQFLLVISGRIFGPRLRAGHVLGDFALAGQKESEAGKRAGEGIARSLGTRGSQDLVGKILLGEAGVENDFGSAETNDIVVAQNAGRTEAFAVENRAVLALEVLNYPAIVAGLEAEVSARQEDIADSDVTIGGAAEDQAAVEFAAGYFLAVGFDDDIGHFVIIEPFGFGGSILGVGGTRRPAVGSLNISRIALIWVVLGRRFGDSA